MAIRVTFQWQSEPAYVYVRFISDRLVRSDVPAVLFPIVAQSRMSRQLAADLERFGLATRQGRAVHANIEVQGEQGRLTFRLQAMMPSFPGGYGGASMLLGLDFISAFGTAALDLRQLEGIITIGE